jgi:hypothetical protein
MTSIDLPATSSHRGDQLDQSIGNEHQAVAIAEGAMLSVVQELSSLNPQNSSWRDKGDQVRNGWGLLAGTDDL